MLGDYLHREQSIGEKRGLSRLGHMLSDRRLELEEKLGLIKKPDSEYTEQ